MMDANQSKKHPMSVIEAIYTRRSCRHFKAGEKIPEWKMEMILDAARYAPSPENMQFWRFIRIRDEDTKKWLADVAQEQAQLVFGSVPYELAADRLWYLPPDQRPAVVQNVADGSLFRYPEDASDVVLVCTSEGGVDYLSPYPFTNFMQLVSAALAIQNMWLTATALGVGVGWNNLPSIDQRREQTLKERFGIPEGVSVVTTLCFGVPRTDRILGPSRFPLEGIAFEEYWGNPYRRISLRSQNEEE
ncbi:MAG: nitroreductase family protein [Candidatus Hodarchaeota archaeon]